MHSSLLLIFFTMFATAMGAEEEGGFAPKIDGNLGLSGGGYGDVYGGKVKEGVYGAGGRIGGNLGLNGGLGLGVGRKRRQAPAGITASNNGASSMTGAQNPDGAFSVSGSSSGGSGTLSLASFLIPTPAPARKRRDVESGSQEVEGSGN